VRELIDRLPLDIVLQIIPYTYDLQNKDLLADIKNYIETKTLLSNYYYNYWIISLEVEEPQDKYWLINDIFAYTNNYNPTMNGYVEQFYNIFKRNPFLQTNQDIDRYILNLEKKDVRSQINVFLGLLTVQERTEFIGIRDW
jgi:hypothetical protein